MVEVKGGGVWALTTGRSMRTLPGGRSQIGREGTNSERHSMGCAVLLRVELE